MRRLSQALPAALALAALPGVVGAQTTTASSAIDTRQIVGEVEARLEREMEPRLREQIKADLREELKAEIKAELAAESAMAGAPADDSWGEEEWKWEAAVEPSLNFLEFDGYFRFRYDFFNNLDLGTYDRGTNTGPVSSSLQAPPTPICNTDPACANARGAGSSLGTANMRLRLEPTLRVHEDVQIKMQVDVLDNLVLGSTPDGFPQNPISPLLGFSQGQNAPSDGRNALFDSIRVKRVWAEVMTPLGQLRVGRMPSHWGMGLLANEGRGLDSDFGDSNDRIMFATKIAGHYIVPAFDWAVSGPTSQVPGWMQGQPFDRDQRDDVDQYILAVARRDSDDEIKEKLSNDELVINYGAYGVYREQALDAGNFFAAGDPADGSAARDLIVRDLNLWAYSVWFKLLWRKLEVEVEHAGILGKVGNTQVAGRFGDADVAADLAMFAGAARFEYKLLNDALRLHFLTVFASGDRQPGWGVTPLQTSPGAGSWDGNQNEDGSITNFRVDPDFHVDLIFWRQLVGMVTDAIVFRPGVQYNFTDGLGARLDLVYSRAWFAESTPSAGFVVPTTATDDAVAAARAPDANLGLETDLKLFYASDDGFHAWLEYGLFVPFAGLDRRVVDGRGRTTDLPAGVAHTIQAMLGITF
jgi:uncharacterized protein (TIGR04551 family)